MNKAIFLDRDGTIIAEKPYIGHLSETFIFPFTAAAINQMNRLGFKVIVVSNQSAVARGICTIEQVEQIHVDITAQLQAVGAVIERFYYCPFYPQGSVPQYAHQHPWRKPEPGMLLQASRDFNISLPDSFMIGDDYRDIQAGFRAGCQTVLVLTGKGEESRLKLKQEGLEPDFVAENILTAVQQITTLINH